LPNPLMRLCLVEVGHIGIEDALELLLLKNQQMVEAFLSDAPQKAFADRIGSGSMNRRFENLDATCPRHPSKALPEFAIVITYQILGCEPIRGRFSQLLGHPGIRRGSCHAGMDHPSRLQEGVEEGEERSKKEIGDQNARRTPRSVLRECAETCSTFDPVAGGCEPSSCTSE